MLKYVLKRIGFVFFTLFIVISVTFILMKKLPIERPIGQEKQQIAYCENQVSLGYFYKFNEVHEEYGDPVYQTSTDSSNKIVTYYYQVPAHEQYFKWLGNILTKWEWGLSEQIEPNVKVSVIIKERLPNTIKLNIIATAVSVPIGILLGIWAALKKNKPTDHIISTSVMVFISVPSFILITFLMLMIKKYAPADTQDVPILRKKERKLKQILSFVFATVTLIIGLLVKNTIISNLLIIGTFLQTITITEIMYKLTKNKYGYAEYIKLQQVEN